MKRFLICFWSVMLTLGFSAAAQAEPSTVEELRQLGAQPLTAPQITELVQGRTLFGQIASGPESGRIRSHRFEPDGYFKSTNSWDKRSDGSKWTVQGEGRLCRRYLGWYNKKVLCRQVYLLANRYYWIDANGQITDIIFEIQ